MEQLKLDSLKYRAVVWTQDALQILHRDSHQNSHVVILDAECRQITSVSKVNNMDGLDADLMRIQFGAEAYTPINPQFAPKNPSNSNTSQLNWAFVDLDCRTEKEFNDTVNAVNRMVATGEIPPPTIKHYSGRGLWLMYRLEPNFKDDSGRVRMPSPKHSGVLKQWQEIQQGLIDKFAKYHADKSARNQGRLFRLVGSTNPKSNKKVHAEYCEELAYSLDELTSWFPPVKKKAKVHKLTPKRTTEPTTEQPTQISKSVWYMKNIYTMGQARCRDLYKLVELRGGDMVGYRNTASWIFARVVQQDPSFKENEEAIASALYEFNKKFIEPLTDSEIMAIAKTQANTNERIKNETICERLLISDKEAKQLECILTANEKRRRDRERKKEQRAPTVAKRQADKLKREFEIIGRIRENEKSPNPKTNDQLALELGLSKSTLMRYKRKINQPN